MILKQVLAKVSTIVVRLTDSYVEGENTRLMAGGEQFAIKRKKVDIIIPKVANNSKKNTVGKRTVKGERKC